MSRTMRDQVKEIKRDMPRRISSSVVNEQEFYEFAHRSRSEGLSIADALASLARAYARRAIDIPEEMRVKAPDAPKRKHWHD